MGIRCRFSGVGGIKDRGFKYTTEVPEDNYTLEIPFTNGTYINPVDVDWGDGTTDVQAVFLRNARECSQRVHRVGFFLCFPVVAAEQETGLRHGQQQRVRPSSRRWCTRTP